MIRRELSSVVARTEPRLLKLFGGGFITARPATMTTMMLVTSRSEILWPLCRERVVKGARLDCYYCDVYGCRRHVRFFLTLDVAPFVRRRRRPSAAKAGHGTAYDNTCSQHVG